MEKATFWAASYVGLGDGYGQMGLARTIAADQHGVAPVGNEDAVAHIPDQSLPDGRAVDDVLLVELQ